MSNIPLLSSLRAPGGEGGSVSNSEDGNPRYDDPTWKQRYEKEKTRTEQLRSALSTLAAALQQSPAVSDLNEDEWHKLVNIGNPSKTQTYRTPLRSARSHTSARVAADTPTPPPKKTTPDQLRNARREIAYKITTDLFQWVCDGTVDEDADRKWFASMIIKHMKEIEDLPRPS
eukprot:Blabericola_migrator_1__12079@NODE_743_length_6671_cov_113_057692_g533_i0_p6_GENE_NODE_743_length_6671_cov_113_057692_g533_i0NODE_743_length_6671_cov_113_057692_g533_i0_p6_ORF_typecomplete_len173_score35_44DNA_pol_A_exoN/PF18305_1/0_2DNA_pol_A_exoN/PF18305_1/7_4e02SPATA1_C/PF15743_5/0_088_NODE_743_length_6671_cov_113_057692_g533_i039094427